ncbi:DNA-binding protein D-ETS-4 [Coccinella septempunctata]|uniref:DNA-binding protein D-ETS-4 n=1 Tax=Coccinella septempunctata TaxID=41139 RepID=UPI001D08EAF7|nr:DNA-binding protein D-ETS-4 [Coccinella septempunctata]
MVILRRNTDVEETMPQIVPSAGFTPPCDYSTFADNFDLSLLPGGEQPLSPSTLLYAQSPQSSDQKKDNEFKVYTTFHNVEQEQCEDSSFRPDFNKLLDSDSESSSSNLPQSPVSNIYLEVPSNSFQPNSPNSVGSLSPYSSQSLLSPNDQFGSYRQSLEANFYPSSPEQSLYAPSPSSVYSKSPREDYLQNHYIKTESISPIPPFSTFTIKEESFLNSCGFSSPSSPDNSGTTSLSKIPDAPDVTGLLETPFLNKQIKQEESTVDFSSLLNHYPENSVLKSFLDSSFSQKLRSDHQQIEEGPKDHKLLREALRDTSYQKKYNARAIDFDLLESYIKMEEDEKSTQDELNEQIARENIEPVLNIAIEQMRKEVDKTCATLGISTDPSHWNAANVFSWIQWTSREFNLPEPSADQWNISGIDLLELSEEGFLHRSNQGGMILHAQLEIWKAAHCSDDLSMSWLPETASSNASSGDISDDDDDVSSIQSDPSKPSTSRTGTHIHLWQFLKELLQNPQTHGSCIRWMDRTKGIFKIEDSVKVARLWGRRKNRPAMNYDKLSRSIRQYYKKGIMKKTERSQRLVYQFCHPYNN